MKTFCDHDGPHVRCHCMEVRDRLVKAMKTIDDFAKESLQDQEKIRKLDGHFTNAKQIIRKLGEESMRDQEKLRKAEEQVIRWLKKAGDLQAEIGRVEEEAARYKAALEKIASGWNLNTSRIEIANEALKGGK